MWRYNIIFYLLFASLVVLESCDNLIEYSPYKAGVKVPDKDLNIKVIEDLQKNGVNDFVPFSIGLFGDTHTYYDDFEKQVDFFNRKDSVDFIVHMGDITLSGIYREFMWFRDISSKIKQPLITLIGNHDYLSNGEFLYNEMFGPFNFTMEYNNCLFVFMDDIIWEKNVKDPNFDWLEEVLKDSEKYKYRFLFSHIPPWDDSFSRGNEYYFNMILDKYNVDLSLHGHTHNFYYGKRYATDLFYFTSSSSEKREVFFLDVDEDGFEIRKENL